MGFLNDVFEGVIGLIKYGNVGGFIRNVIYGVLNFVVKFVGILLDGLGKMMDNWYQLEWEYIRYYVVISGEYFVVGIYGLVYGIIGGLISVIILIVEGVKIEGGVSGFIFGFGKGFVGIVIKLVVGVLDFVLEIVQVVRDIVIFSGFRIQVQRVWKLCCCMGFQGLFF